MDYQHNNKSTMDTEQKSFLFFDIFSEKAPALSQPDRSRKQCERCFSVAKGKEKREKTVILVDDVITTGATTASCTEALLAAGCKGVRVVSLARD